MSGKTGTSGETETAAPKSVVPSHAKPGTTEKPPEKPPVNARAAKGRNATPDTASKGGGPDPMPAKQPIVATSKTTPEPPPPGEVRQKPLVEVHASAGNYSKFQLGKNHTLFVLAFDSITRQNYFLNAYRELMTQDQIFTANQLVDSYDDQFARLRDARAAILEAATDDNPDTPILLLNNRVETLELAISVRKRIVREVLTREQRKLHKENVERRKELQGVLHPRNQDQDSAGPKKEPSDAPSKSGEDSGS